MSEAMWTFSDLSDDELAWYTRQACECLTPTQSGTRNGYTCPPHRAQAEIDRRVLITEATLQRLLAGCPPPESSRGR